MAIDDLLWGNYELGTETAKLESQKRKVSSELDKDAFLTLLITQMKYQDPLNPVDDKEFLGQMAQFTSLEQMQNLNKSYASSQSFALIGKTILANVLNEDTGKYTQVAGRVDSVTVNKGVATLVVGKIDVPLDSVTNVFEDEKQLGLFNAINSNIYAYENMNMIGKCIQALTLDEKGNVTGFVEGKIEYVKVVSGVPVFVIGNKEVFPNEMIMVSEDKMLIGKFAKASVLVDGVTKIVEGEIEDVKIIGGKAYAIIDGKEANIEKIDALTEALRHVGKEISYKDIKGKVDYVLIRGGKAYYIIGDKEVLFDDTVKAAATATSTTTETAKETETTKEAETTDE